MCRAVFFFLFNCNSLIGLRSTFVEPRYAGMLKNSKIETALGRSLEEPRVTGTEESSA